MTRPAAKTLALATASVLMAGCAQWPVGPRVAVTPGPFKPFDVFTQDDELCRGWAAHAIGIPGHDAAAQAFVASTALGAALGALAGTAAGGGREAGSGAAAGALIGAVAGTGHSASVAWSEQRRYDMAYSQCMYARGNVVPSYGYRHLVQPAPPPSPPPPPLPSGH